MKTAGLVLAAGASARMGRPKALLEVQPGIPLARVQYEKLLSGGCDKALVVLGHAGAEIALALKNIPVHIHTGWASGRTGSVCAGLRALDVFDGFLLLPVDTVGIRTETLTRLLNDAAARRPFASRPFYKGQPGQVLWISNQARIELLNAGLPDDEPLNTWFADRIQPFPTDDPSVLTNINTDKERAIYFLRNDVQAEMPS